MQTWPPIDTEPPPDSSRRAHNKHAVRTSLLQAARQLFAERGVAETTAEEIAEAAGVSRATFFNYFQNKHGIVIALHDAHVSTLGLLVDDLLSEPLTTAGRLDRLFADVAATAATAPVYFASLTGELERELAVPAVSAARTEKLTSTLVRLLTPGVAAGEVREDLPLRFLAQMVGSTYISVIRYWRESTDYDITLNSARASHFLTGALAPGKG
ncbi:TetR/AcrR family transcriptional regulator [Dietzia maris]|uniref:TetR/AcrR family transcriptional regulator n=1 Tax=Dietzia maris TaxID=37915 RepID=A0AAE4QVQ9_9ACTN|nr:TetR/AcrR family transcriptional regulator [Dietzia maris]MDV6299179.1 TetR/AcrR family transcriptional regulator [Dietzia maris]